MSMKRMKQMKMIDDLDELLSRQAQEKKKPYGTGRYRLR